MKDRIQALAARNRAAKTEEEKQGIALEMEALKNENPKEFTESLESLVKTTAKEVENLTMAERMGEITKMVSMAYIAKKYFGKSRSWLAHKLNGNTVNGKAAQFSDEELSTLKSALSDMSQKLGSMSVSI